MTRSEAFSYPVMLLAGLVLMGWSVVTASRDGITAPVSLTEQLLGVGMLFLGFLASALLARIARGRQDAHARNGTVLRASDFNPVLVQEVIDRALPSASRSPDVPQPWELNARALLARDRSLALAKLRLDIERQLLVLAYRHGIGTPAKTGGVVRMAESLVGLGILPAEILAPLHQILDVCNRAIHGSDVPDDLAEAVISVGEELLHRLADLSSRETASRPGPRPS